METQITIVKAPELPAKRSSRYPRNQEIMVRYLEGQSIEQIADYFDLTTGTIRNILKSPLVEAELNRLSKLISENGVKERIKTLAPEAVDVVRDTMRGEVKSELRLKAANSLLDRHPELSARKSDEGNFATGLGEAIIRQIGKKLYEKLETTPKEVDVTDAPAETNSNL